ncbi:MAG TPA: LUD domain-containing protein [Thermoplasmata archaeon]|nr:LUD domain-containing protein [Thermoplasmata archaeon]
MSAESSVASLVEFAEARTEPASPEAEYARPAGRERVERTAHALRSHGIGAVVTAGRDAARAAVLERLPPGSEVFDFTSKTLEALGITSDELSARGYRVLRPSMIEAMKSGRPGEARRIGAAPEYALGSVHAVTEQGQLVIASASGSQLPAYAYGAGHVIWAVGTHKIVPDLEGALRRIERYAYPLEDARARAAYGVPSAVNKLLIIGREATPDRATVVFVPEAVGF